MNASRAAAGHTRNERGATTTELVAWVATVVIVAAVVLGLTTGFWWLLYGLLICIGASWVVAAVVLLPLAVINRHRAKNTEEMWQS